jgi:integrase/recombinase XerD
LLRVFYKWLKKSYRAAPDPTVFSKIRKTWTNEPRSVLKEKLNDVLEKARARANLPGASPVDIRDWGILELFYGCGARVSEMSRLDVNDLSVKQGDVLIHGKRSKDRLPPITDAAREAVDFYLKNARPKLDRSGKDQQNDALFLSKQGKRLGRQGIRKIVKKADPDLYPHALRHSYGQHRADAGDRIENIQNDLGHAKLRTTMVYIPAVSFDQLQYEHRRCHPRGRDFAKHLDRQNTNSPPPDEGRRTDHSYFEGHP